MRDQFRLLAFGAVLVGVCAVSVAKHNPESNYPHVTIGPSFTTNQSLLLPRDFRKWMFLGSPLTPHGLNDGHASFPEFHNVYVEPAAYDYYTENGEWPEGTVIVKELQLTQPGSFDDGSRTEASGRGYFPGRPNGMDVSVKDSSRFKDTDK